MSWLAPHEVPVDRAPGAGCAGPMSGCFSHDDESPAMRCVRAQGVGIAEFPVNEETARDAAEAGDLTCSAPPMLCAAAVTRLDQGIRHDRQGLSVRCSRPTINIRRRCSHFGSRPTAGHSRWHRPGIRFRRRRRRPPDLMTEVSSLRVAALTSSSSTTNCRCGHDRRHCCRASGASDRCQPPAHSTAPRKAAAAA